MASRDQLASQIRFQLDQLSAQNRHHEFEHLSRHLARLRICSNILPATGPVSAGGDQGRDFESFLTYLSKSPIAGSSFVGLTSQEAVAFACTLTQKAKLKTKIKSDITVIVGGAVPVASIHYFCSSDLPVAERHELQKWTREEHGIHLEVYDGQAIAELLVDSDVFWIATRFLSIPSEMYPSFPVSKEETWYVKLRSKWKTSEVVPENFADFGELKAAVRHATWTESAKLDLPFWINKLTDLRRATAWPLLQRRSTYEIAVASLRGLGTMEGYEDELRSYFSEIPTLYETADLEDAGVLWLYCAGGFGRGIIPLAWAELILWRDAAVVKVEEELRATELPGRRCSLLDIRGFLALHMSAGTPKGTPDFQSAVRYWLELMALVREAPLFPLERFADRLTKFMGMFEHPDLDSITDQVDQLLATRSGQAAAAEKCRDRAMALYEKGEIIRSLKQIHRAKVKWFAEETLRESIMTMLFLAHCYLDLGLAFAAKYHALMAAYAGIMLPRDDVRRFVPAALSTAALCDYRQGAWFGYLEMEHMVLATFSVFSREVDPSDPNSEINKALFHISWIQRLAQRVEPALLSLVDERVSQWGLSEELKECLESWEDPWKGKDLSEIWDSLAEQLLGQPFADVGPRREVSFQALGVTWKFEWDNTHEVTAVAEQFVAVLQIILADLAGRDLCLLRTKVEVTARAGEGTEYLLKMIPSNTSTKWDLRLPISVRPKGDSLDLEAEVLSVAISLLQSVSLLQGQNIIAIIEDAFRDGLYAKAFAVERYELLYCEFISREMFGRAGRHMRAVPEAGRSFTPVSHDQLAWVDGPGPGYSQERAEAGLRRRYEGTVRPIQRTFERLVRQREFQEVVGALREEGWLDWHILLAVMHLVLNYRIQRAQSLGLSRREVDELSDQWVNELEKENSFPVPLEEFSAENLRLQLRFSMLATVRLYGLELPHATPDFEAISDFLRQRYRYWTDDVEHPEFGF